MATAACASGRARACSRSWCVAPAPRPSSGRWRRSRRSRPAIRRAPSSSRPPTPTVPPTFDAHVYASCQVPERGSTEICTEEILIKIGGELAAAPLRRPWRRSSSTTCRSCSGGPTTCRSDGTRFVELASEECDRLLVDSGHFRDDGRERMHGMAAAMHEGLVVHDVSWMRLMLWRELLAVALRPSPPPAGAAQRRRHPRRRGAPGSTGPPRAGAAVHRLAHGDAAVLGRQAAGAS